MATIETVKEALAKARTEISDFLDNEGEAIDADTHDELAEIEDVITDFLGDETEEESPE